MFWKRIFGKKGQKKKEEERQIQEDSLVTESEPLDEPELDLETEVEVEEEKTELPMDDKSEAELPVVEESPPASRTSSSV